MAFIATKGKYHLALDGVGLLLQGAPNAPAYLMEQAPLYGQRFASGDNSYKDFSFWWFWAQTDWSGGIKYDSTWADDAKYYDSKGITPMEKAGSVMLNWKQLNSMTVSGKNMTWMAWACAYGTFMVLGRNETDSKMSAYNVYDGSLIWEDTTTGASEKINCADDFYGNEVYIGCRTVGSGASMLKKGTGGSFADVGTFNNGNGIYEIITYHNGDKMFLFTYNAGIWEYVRSTGTVTQKTTTYPYGTTAGDTSISRDYSKRAAIIGDRIYFVLYETNSWQTQLWAYDIGDNAYVHIYTFGAGSKPQQFIERDTNLYLFDNVTTANRVYIWKYDSVAGSMTKIHELGRGTYNYQKYNPVRDNWNIYFVMDDYTSDYQIWGLDQNDCVFSGITPPASYASSMNMLAISKTGNLAVCKNGASGTNKVDEFDSMPQNDRQTSGWVKTSIYDGEIPAIDKLWYNITINFDKFVSGQSIQIDYSLDGGANFTTLGTASYTVDGGTVTSRTFFFGKTIVSKTMMLKFTLAGGGSNTPSFNAYAVQYVPVPLYTKQWRININCGDEVKRLDGGLVETTGRELKARIEMAWWTKALLDFEDLDYATTTLNGSLSAAGTTITVVSTADFPEQGRLRIEDEEIFYTGKTPTTFTGCTRGCRGTVGVTHADTTVVNNAYRVIVTDIQAKVPILLEDKSLEYVTSVVLREG